MFKVVANAQKSNGFKKPVPCPQLIPTDSKSKAIKNKISLLRPVYKWDKLYRPMYLYPVQWNSATETLEVVEDKRQLFYCVASYYIILIGLCVLPYSAYLLVNLFQPELRDHYDSSAESGVKDHGHRMVNLDLHHYILKLINSGLFAVLSFDGAITGTAILLNRRIVSYVFNEMTKVEKGFIAQYTDKISLKRQRRQQHQIIFMDMFVSTMGLYIVLMPIYMVFTSQDPLILVLGYFFPPSSTNQGEDIQNYIFLGPRYMLLLVVIAESTRQFTFKGTIFTVVGGRFMNSIDLLSTQGIRKFPFSSSRTLLNIEQFFINYSQLHVLSSTLYGMTSLITFIFSTVSMIVLVCFNYVTIKLTNIIPLPFYLLFPTSSVILVGLAALGFDEFAQIYEISSEMMKKCKLFHVNVPRNRGYWVKKFGSVPPLRFYVGLGGYNFFHVTRKTKGTFFYYNLSYTASLVLAL